MLTERLSIVSIPYMNFVCNLRTIHYLRKRSLVICTAIPSFRRSATLIDSSLWAFLLLALGTEHKREFYFYLGWIAKIYLMKLSKILFPWGLWLNPLLNLVFKISKFFSLLLFFFISELTTLCKILSILPRHNKLENSSRELAWVIYFCQSQNRIR